MSSARCTHPVSLRTRSHNVSRCEHRAGKGAGFLILHFAGRSEKRGEGSGKAREKGMKCHGVQVGD
jgi:hypothetical protein